MKKTRALLAALAVTALLVLTGCESQDIVAVQPDGSITGTLDVSGDAALLGAANINCTSIDSLISGRSGGTLTGEESSYAVDDQSDADQMHCVVTFDSGKPATGSSVLSETDTSYILSLPRGLLNEKNLRTLNLMSPTFSLVVAMPGDIISAPGASISGNTATFTDINVLVDGLNVEGAKQAADGGDVTPLPDTHTAAGSGTTQAAHAPTLTDYFTWALIGIGVLLAAVLGLGIYRQRTRLRARAQAEAEQRAQADAAPAPEQASPLPEHPFEQWGQPSA